MLPSKFFIKTIAWIVVGLIIAGVIYIICRLSNPEKIDKYSNIFVHYSDSDSTSVLSQIESNDNFLILYFHPECMYCHGNLNSLAKIDMPDLVVDLVSYAPKDSVDALVQQLDFSHFDEVNVIYDTTLVWNNKLGIKTIPTTIFFKNGQLKNRRSGYFKLDQILYE